MPLSISGLSKTYSNGTQALKDVSVTVQAGMFGLLGPNGAGKSTLMRTAATLQAPDHGSVTLDEIDVLANPDEARRRLGYLPQEFGLDPSARAGDLLDHFAALKGVSRRADRRQVVADALHATNLYDQRGARLGAFSGGMKQRFGIAQALLGDPRLLILDEPTAGLDPDERSRLLNLLSALGADRMVILSTHIVDDVSQLCSRMAIISHGTVLLTGEPEAVTSALQGKIWETSRFCAAPGDLKSATSLSTRLVAGHTRVRVLADEKPGPDFEMVEPSLQDVYFRATKTCAV